MIDLIELLDRPHTSIAVVGATDSPSKYGNVIYRDLKRKGYTVYPVNPNRARVDGDPAFPRLSNLQVKLDIIDFVVPPTVALTILEECLKLGLENVWLQPGSESTEVLAFVQEHNFNYIAQACIMVESRLKS